MTKVTLHFPAMGYIQKTRNILKVIIAVPLVLCIYFLSFPSVRFFIGFIPMEKCHLESGYMLVLDNRVDATLNLLSRNDVQTCTAWKAPIIWEGMFDPRVYDKTHQEEGSRVALTVFAVGRYLEAYLETFLSSAERYFMKGLPVTYYVFTDSPEKVPKFNLAPQRSMKVNKVPKHSRWQDISMMRMKTISDFIESDIRRGHSHVFCFDVDQVFTGRFGSEALGDLVALLHAYFYRLPKNFYTYDQNPLSKAYMESGDYYYHAAIFGGSCDSVKALTDACYQNIMADKENNVEALWHDESHLNKYFLFHKPTRVLSPEYCWDTAIGYRRDIKVSRLLWAPKQYEKLRT
ncbi:alpha-1,3-galactosyltransferase 2-like [Betta splendens]|uniref:Alpha-1,3-galactosyltransferase 2-like n=1 Tax=Betta splendens TaxID=158456 RepID=A0A6P7MQY2_BETSP|nr:alpha-1,3-galactosyltransferase 2-like [Betta splendens]XP_029008200.1 alpha-1,3-galactosyltransferase 2-like [Betta splendens]